MEFNEEEFTQKIALCAYKPEEECDSEEQELRAREKKRCGVSFLYFLRYVKIIEPPKPGQTGGGIIPLELWAHILKIVASFLTEPLISILKARQIGLSTIVSAYILWYAMSHIGANILLFSKGQPEAKELLAKSKRIYDQLPDFLRLHPEPAATEELGFPIMKSSIKAFASTPSAGISYTASIVVCDEHSEHPYAEENYLSSKPTRDAGGQFISIFTANKLQPDNLATAIFQDALEKKNDFVPIFFPWDVVPSRDKEWYDKTQRNIPERELARLSPELYMAQNYPASIEEALSRPESLVVFDKKTLNALMDNVRSPINLDWENFNNDIVHIYKDYHIGNFYIAGTDVSLGVGRDFNVTCVMDVKTGDIVADIMSQSISPEELALHSVTLLKHYHSPLWWIEHNLWGRTVIKKAVELGYTRLGHRGDKPVIWSAFGDEELKRVGFFTDDKSRTDLFGALIPAINDRQITIYNEQGLRQFYSLIRNMNKKGKIEALGGGHDDYPIATGICWLKREGVRTSAWEHKPIETLTFRRSR